MLTLVVFDFVDSKSGKITYNPPSSYVAATGWANCQTGKNTQTGEIQRAYFNFDTSNLPDHAQIEKVEFLIYVPKLPAIDPVVYRVGFSIGTFIGALLDGNVDEWNGGTYMVTLYSRPTSGIWLNLAQGGNHPEGLVNRTGDTDIRVWDYSVGDIDHWFWMTSFNTSRDKCKLRVTYSLPSATITGRGGASASAEIVLPAAGMAAGIGSVQATAGMISTGSAALTGRGMAEVVVGLIVPAEANATGTGSAQVNPAVVISDSAAATGQGTAELDATIVATGVAIVTGRGEASCALVATYFEPPSLHEGSRAVRPTHAALHSVAWIHAGTRRARRPS